MRAIWIAVTAAASAAALLTTPAAAATVLGVNWSSSCGPTNCFNEKGVFTQTWSAEGASGPQTIGQFLMARGILGDLDNRTFGISFSVGGKEVGTWGSYNMAGIGGDQLSFDGFDFLWNPEDGDLVLTLTIKPAGGSGGGFFFASAPNVGSGGGSSGGGAPSGGDQQPQGGPGEPDGGPAGAPDGGVQTPSAVPEPAAWALMIAGFGMAGATLRQRRRVTS